MHEVIGNQSDKNPSVFFILAQIYIKIEFQMIMEFTNLLIPVLFSNCKLSSI